MSTAGVISTVAVAAPWVVLIGIRAMRAFRDPDRWDAGGHGGVLDKRYVEKQFDKPKDESRLL